MTKFLYQDEIISVKESVKENEKYIYTHEEISGGKRIVVLPFRKKIGGRQFLLRREFIPCWDSHTDVCAISSKVLMIIQSKQLWTKLPKILVILLKGQN